MTGCPGGPGCRNEALVWHVWMIGGRQSSAISARSLLEEGRFLGRAADQKSPVERFVSGHPWMTSAGYLPACDRSAAAIQTLLLHQPLEISPPLRSPIDTHAQLSAIAIPSESASGPPLTLDNQAPPQEPQLENYAAGKGNAIGSGRRCLDVGAFIRSAPKG